MKTKIKNRKPLYHYILVQDNIIVARVQSTSQHQAEKEINHYAFVYSQDGPVKIIGRKFS